MREAPRNTLQHHRILCLPRKMTLMIDPAHIWNVIYNARSKTHPPTWHSKIWRKSAEWKQMKHHLLWRTMREWSEHDPNMNWPSRTPPPSPSLLFTLWRRILYVLRLSTQISPNAAPATPTSPNVRLLWKVRLQRHRIFCLPRKTTLMIDPPQIWNGIYIGRSNSLQRHQILRLPRKWDSKSPKFMKKTCWKRMKRHLQFTMADNARLIWAWSEHELWSSRSHRSPSLLFTLWRRSLYRKMRHFVLRLSTVISPNAAPARKSDTPTSPNVREKCHCNITKCYHEKWDSNVTKYCACHEKWLSWLILLRQMRCAMCDGRCEWCDWCHLIELWLNCDLREQRQDRTVTLLNCYMTELLRDWTVTYLNCCFNVSLQFLNLRNSEVSRLNFLWSCIMT